MSERSLIVRLKRGDQKALEQIYSDHRVGFIAYITNSHNCTNEEAIDIYQYVILSFYENVVDGSFEEMNAAGIKTYLYSIGKNKLLGDLRKKTKISLKGKFNDDDLIQSNNEIDLEKAEQFEKVSDIISHLGDPCKRILELFYFNKLSIDEISEVMGYSSGNTVKNLKYKCIKRIKKIIESHTKDER